MDQRYLLHDFAAEPAVSPGQVCLPNLALGDTKRLCLFQSNPHVSGCFLYFKLDDASPSLQSHYRTFITTTGRSAPVPCLGSLTLAGLPLVCLP